MLSYDEVLGAVRIGVTDRIGGTSIAPYDSLNLGDHVGDDPVAVTANRAVLAQLVAPDGAALVLMAQVHGNSVAVVRAAAATPLEVDAMVTDQPGLALVVLVADCAPVVLADSQRGIVAVAHAGRRGLVNGVLDATIGAMHDLGAREIVGRVGPAICAGCYEVPTQVADEVGARVPAALGRTRWESSGIDIGKGAMAELARLGVRAARAGGCTYESSAHYSYRRDGVTGRFAAFAVLRP